MDLKNKFLGSILALAFVSALALTSCQSASGNGQAMAHSAVQTKQDTIKRVMKSEEEWKKELTSEQYRILREKGTERAFTGEYWDEKSKGVYKCSGCGSQLFSSETKYKSGSGWPSFYQPIAENRVTEHSDRSHGMVRTEVTCTKCGGHLGHVFTDGPRPTGLRYCINSASLKLDKE